MARHLTPSSLILHVPNFIIQGGELGFKKVDTRLAIVDFP